MLGERANVLNLNLTFSSIKNLPSEQRKKNSKTSYNHGKSKRIPSLTA